jgi:hypothetical protein
MKDKVVVYGNDPILLLARRLVLEHVGFTVFTTGHFEEEVELMTAQEPQLLILCQSLHTEETQSALIMARELRPKMKTLVMLEPGTVYDCTSHNGESLRALQGPDALLTVVDRMISESNSMQPQA